MDTNLKNAISAMRKDIAELEKKQKSIKPQRKTVWRFTSIAYGFNKRKWRQGNACCSCAKLFLN